MKSLEDLNFYELLNLSPDDGPAEVEVAFKKAVQTYASDSLAVYSVLSEEERERILSRIHQAYTVLVDETRRNQYDAQLQITGNAAQAEIESASGSGQGTDTSIWGKFRHVLPAHDSVGARVSRLLRPRGRKRKESDLSISSGYYLRSVRRLKGITLEEISENTKIKIRYLQALEDEDYDSLPAGAYRRYILKALADAIDLDPEAVADDFQNRIAF
jgi:DnaJ-class molecular chaperone